MTAETSQITEAKNGSITQEVFECAQKEGVDIEVIRQKVADGSAVILKNNKRNNCAPVVVGDGLRIKVNANIGSASKNSSISNELDKARIVCQTEVDTIMDLSRGDYLDETRREILAISHIPTGSNPIFQACKNTSKSRENVEKLSKDSIFSQIEKHCKDGIDFISLHCSITKALLAQLEEERRITGITSTSGSLLARYMYLSGKENPLYEHFDELLDLIKEYDVVLSLGNALRPGCTFDSADRAHFMETIITGDLIKRARRENVQVMVEFGGYIPMNKIPMMLKTTKELTLNAPVFALGPMVLDSAAGYDNIAASIGSAVAAQYGANMLCCVTSAQQTEIPNAAQIREAITTTKIAAQSVDLAKCNKKALEKNMSISQARAVVDIKKEIDSAIDKSAYDRIVSKKRSKR